MMRKIKKLNKTILLSALSALAFGGIAAGTTYALFTSTAETSVSVSTGKVNVTTTATDLKTYSGVDLTGDPETDKVEATTVGTFTNGGTATIDGNDLKLVNMTPGDKVTFSIMVTNNSTVAAKYRTVVKKGNDTGLFNGLEIKVDGEEFLGSSMISSYSSLGSKDSTFTVDVEVNLPSDSGNVYQDKKCDLTFRIEAVQGNAFTGNTYEVNRDNIQEYLDGQHGSLDGATLVLESGNYDKIELGRATSYPGSNTQYYIGGISSDNEKTLEEFKEIKNGTGWSASSYYVRNINNLTIKAKDGAQVNIGGLSATGGHINGTNVHDYVLDKDISGSAYYLAQNWSDVRFEGLTFTSGVEIASSQAETLIDGVTFTKCNFINSGDKTNTRSNYGITYYNETNNERITDLVVNNCKFEHCFHAIYCMHIKNVTVVNNSFKDIGLRWTVTDDKGKTTEYTGGNALQNSNTDSGGAVNEGAMIIKNNTFEDFVDRILRFGKVASDTQYVIARNKATNAHDDDGEVIKATSLADGITYDIHDNNWGEGTCVYNKKEFNDR